MIKKGIILAGGLGTRMSPLTKAVNKQLLPLYDKPLIFYPLSTLILAKIKDILIISNPDHISSFKSLLGKGSKFGVNISYEPQENPNGIASALSIGKDFLKKSHCALILGDNVFYGNNLGNLISKLMKSKKLASIFTYNVKDPSRYGILEFTKMMEPKMIVEKPENPKSKRAVTGLYVYKNSALQNLNKLKPSSRGELEITDFNNLFFKSKQINIEHFGRGIGWFDAGTSKSMMEASMFVQFIQERQGVLIGSPEETSLNSGFIEKNSLKNFLKNSPDSDYYNNLRTSLDNYQL